MDPWIRIRIRIRNTAFDTSKAREPSEHPVHIEGEWGEPMTLDKLWGNQHVPSLFCPLPQHNYLFHLQYLEIILKYILIAVLPDMNTYC